MSKHNPWTTMLGHIVIYSWHLDFNPLPALDPDQVQQLARLGPEVMQLFSYSTQLCMKFQLLLKTKMLKNKDINFLAFELSLSDVIFIMLINVKMPTIVGILTFMSRINFMLSWVELEKSFINLETWSGFTLFDTWWYCWKNFLKE